MNSKILFFIPIYINKYWFYYFPISRDFYTEFLLFYQKLLILVPILLGIMAKIVSKIMVYHYAKFHAFIGK